MDNLTAIFGEPISVYSRADAIKDGTLVDLANPSRSWPSVEIAKLLREHFPRLVGDRAHPVCLTAGLEALIEQAVKSGTPQWAELGPTTIDGGTLHDERFECDCGCQFNKPAMCVECVGGGYKELDPGREHSARPIDSIARRD